MFRSFPKRGRLKLTGQAYAQLVQDVLTRDEWQCRRCASREHLQVHHLIKRSEIRIDATWNLCTLCADCHELVERHKVDVVSERPGQLDADILPPQAGAICFRYR
jgi:5-methylcytosine-specific restriction endonuclease McrA